MKRYRFLLYIFFSAVLLAIFIFGTRPGLVLVVKGVTSLSGGSLTVDSVQGRLAGSYTLGGIALKTAEADVDIETFHWAWQPLALLKGQLAVTSTKAAKIFVTLKDSKSDEKQEAENSKPPAIFLPVSLQLGELFLEDIRIVDTDGSIVFQLYTLNASLNYKDGLAVVDSFQVDGPEVGLTVHGNAERQNEWTLDLMGTWRLAGYGFHPSEGTFSLAGPVDTLGVNVALNDPGEIQVAGVVKDLLGDATWTADVDAKNINLETWILYCPEIILESVHGEMSGDFGHYRGLVKANGFWGVADELHLVSDIDGDGLGIVFSSLRIDRKDSSAVATGGSISWEKLFSWVADLDVKDFDLDMFFPGFDGRMSSQFHSVGDVTEQGLVASFDLRNMDGHFAGYDWSATGSIGLTDEKVFTQDLRINSDSVGGLALVREAELSWLEALSWKGDVDFDHFDPGFLHPEAAGDISGNISSTLDWDKELPTGELHISGLSGTMRGSKLSGGGSLAFDGTSLNTTGLVLTLGKSQLQVSGEVEESLGLQFSLSSPDLSDLGEGLQGTLKVKGQVSGTKNAPDINVTLAGNNLQSGNEKIKTVSGHFNTSLGTAGTIDAGLVVEDSLIQGINLQEVDVDLSGTSLNHKLQAQVSGPDGELRFLAGGMYKEGWQGKLSELTLKTKRYGAWQQLDSAPLDFSPESMSVKSFCLVDVEPGDSGSVCLFAKLDRGEKKRWSVEAVLTDFMLKQFSEMDLGLPPVTGILKANLSANGDGRGIHSASAYAELPAFDTLLKVTDDEFIPVRLRDSLLHANLEDQQLMFDFSFAADKGGSLKLAGQVQGIGQFDVPLAACAIEGKLTLDRYYLSSLAAFTGFGLEPTGWISSSFDIGGTFAQPEVDGELAIQEGGLELAYQGITLDGVVVAIESKDSGAVIRAKAQSGGGSLNVNGFVARAEDGVEATLQLGGEDFLLVNLPEYSLRMSPDAEVKINKNRGQLRGRVKVPSGLIAPEELSGAVKVSEDVVYLGEEKVHGQKGFPFFLDLDVLLGDDVRVEGYGLEGRLGGKLNVKITPADFITARGELDLLDSTFSFYGRSLDIARGRMLFTGGPIDNPGVDIRAQKVITAETARDDEYTVGVDISGLVQDLRFHLFSDPYMEDTDILSQMVVGHSFATSSEEEGNLLQSAAMSLGLAGGSKLMKGIGDLILIDDLHLEGSTRAEDVSLVVGKRITEDLYIGYDMNMFSQLGQFRVRYNLDRGFYVETRSSSESTGADLIYTFEK